MQTVLLIILGLFAVVLILAANKPKDFRIERKTTIAAPPDRIAPFIDDFHRWSVWSPWEGMDPKMKRTFSGADRGVGAIYEWTGNDKVGTGRMEIKAVEPSARITIQLDFLRPWEAHNTADFVLRPSGAATEVSWAMFGPSPFMSRVMGLFLNLDKMVGKDFEKGLAQMKEAVEKG